MSQINMIPLSGCDTLEFVPSAFKDRDDPPTFFIRVPTFAVRDKMGAILFQRGFVPATIEQGRGLLVDALFDLYPEPEAEELASFLEDYWTKAEVHEELVRGWQLREAQRTFDVTMGVRKELPPEPVPVAPYTMRDQARQARIVTDALTHSERYRAFQARFYVQHVEEEEMIVRLFLLGWRDVAKEVEGGGLKVIEAKRDERDLLTTDSIEAVRQWLSDEAAPEAWDEIKTKLKEQMGAPGKLEKNFDSPLDTTFSLNGLQTSSGDLEISDGNLTTSSTTPIPSTRSPATSGASRRSRKGKNIKSRVARQKNGQTAAPS